MNNQDNNNRDSQQDEKIARDDSQQINGSNTIKDPEDWTTGTEPMTGAQASYLRTLASEAGEHFDERLSKAEASIRIDELQHKTGRGISNNDGQKN